MFENQSFRGQGVYSSKANQNKTYNLCKREHQNSTHLQFDLTKFIFFYRKNWSNLNECGAPMFLVLIYSHGTIARAPTPYNNCLKKLLTATFLY